MFTMPFFRFFTFYGLKNTFVVFLRNARVGTCFAINA